MPIRCEIVSQDRMVWAGEADMVVVPGASGEMGILPDHAPLLSTLKPGFIKVVHEGEEEVFTVTGGVVEVRPDKVTVLANASEHVAEIDVKRAEEARQRAEELLKTTPPTAAEHLKAQAALQRARIRLEAARRFRPKQGPQIQSGPAEDED
jgi:F-type H+-transporting ATPase subunit epsilon